MLAVVISRPGPPDVLELREVPTPEPRPDEVLVRVHASALNRADLAQRVGRYPAPPGWPADIPGLEFAGEVVGRGRDVSRWRPGDRVFGLVGGGAHAQFLTAHEETIARIPDSLAWRHAAAVPEAFITAHDAMVTQGHLLAGERVVIHAVASGVGLAAVQVARAWGAHSFGTTRHREKLEMPESLGMETGLVLPDAPEPFVPAVLEWSGGRGADLFVDLVGGRYVGLNVAAAAPMARLLLIGAVGGSEGHVDIRQVLYKRLTLRGTVMRSRQLPERIAVAEGFTREIVPRTADGTFSATIDTVFPLERVAEAHARLASNETIGKIVLEMPTD